MSIPKKEILYIDDDPNMLAAAKAVLEATHKFSVTTSNDAKKTLLSLDKHKPDLIILDVVMPEVDGITAFKIIRNFPALDAVPVLFMTTKTSQGDLETYKSLGKTSVIMKPFDPEDLPFQIDLFLQQL